MNIEEDKNGKSKENLVITVSVIAESLKIVDVLEIGQILVTKKVDSLVDGGFWIWDITTHKEFYSPNFRKSLGFENEDDFPSTSDSWQKYIDGEDKLLAFTNFGRALETSDEAPYYQDVNYTKKDGTRLKINCSGIILRIKGVAKYLIGTHKIIY